MKDLKKKRISHGLLLIFISMMLLGGIFPSSDTVNAKDTQVSEVSTKQENDSLVTKVSKDGDLIDLEFEYINLVGGWKNIIEGILTANQSSFAQIRNIVVKGGKMNIDDLQNLTVNCLRIKVLDLKKSYLKGIFS